MTNTKSWLLHHMNEESSQELTAFIKSSSRLEFGWQALCTASVLLWKRQEQVLHIMPESAFDWWESFSQLEGDVWLTGGSTCAHACSGKRRWSCWPDCSRTCLNRYGWDDLQSCSCCSILGAVLNMTSPAHVCPSVHLINHILAYASLSHAYLSPWHRILAHSFRSLVCFVLVRDSHSSALFLAEFWHGALDRYSWFLAGGTRPEAQDSAQISTTSKGVAHWGLCSPGQSLPWHLLYLMAAYFRTHFWECECIKQTLSEFFSWYRRFFHVTCCCREISESRCKASEGSDASLLWEQDWTGGITICHSQWWWEWQWLMAELLLRWCWRGCREWWLWWWLWLLEELNFFAQEKQNVLRAMRGRHTQRERRERKFAMRALTVAR